MDQGKVIYYLENWQLSYLLYKESNKLGFSRSSNFVQDKGSTFADLMEADHQYRECNKAEAEGTEAAVESLPKSQRNAVRHIWIKDTEPSSYETLDMDYDDALSNLPRLLVKKNCN